MRVSEVMSSNPNCCTPSCTVRMAARILRQFDVGILPVIDDFLTRKLVGVITDRDLCLRVLAEVKDPGECTVKEFMTANPVCCSPETDVRKALAQMATRRVRRIPVVDRDRRIQGIVSLYDLVRHDAVSPNDIAKIFKKITASRVREEVRARAAAA
ncbi:MAG: CBS domain-containing protein [Terriglobales bacterium]